MKKFNLTYKIFLIIAFCLISFDTHISRDNGADSSPRKLNSLTVERSLLYSSFVNVSIDPKKSPMHKSINQKSFAETPIVILLLLSSIIIIGQIIKRIKSYYFAKLKFLKSDNERLKGEIELLNTKYSKLSAYLNHEFKNALNSIQSASALCFEHYEALEDDERNTLMFSISNSTKFLERFIDTLSTWLKVDGDIKNMKPVLLEVLPIVVEEINKHDQMISDKDIKIKLEIGEGSFAFMDEVMFHTVIGSLISNGVKYSLDGGQVVVSGREDKDRFLISVKDFGVGISKENQIKLFDTKNVFNTVGPNGERGTGLSLIICKKYVEAAKGELLIDSNENEGCTVTISIPKQKMII